MPGSYICSLVHMIFSCACMKADSRALATSMLSFSVAISSVMWATTSFEASMAASRGFAPQLQPSATDMMEHVSNSAT